MSTGKYVAPHLRAKQTGHDEVTMRLRRKIQGQLNRLSEDSIDGVFHEVEKAYSEHARNTMNTVLGELLLNAVAIHSNINDTYIAINASLIAAIYTAIGTDAAASLVQGAVERFDLEYNKVLGDAENPQEDIEQGVGGKEALNLAMLITHLYNFQVISNRLMYDLIRQLTVSIHELHTELLLNILRLCGPRLRQDDPTALKDIIQSIHQTISQESSDKLSARTKFMIEVITDLKNNRQKGTIAATSQTTSEFVRRLRKYINNLGRKRQGYVPEPLGVTLKDVREVKTKGKWWIVGHSWVGNQADGSTEQDDEGKKVKKAKVSSEVEAIHAENKKLLELAKAQNMNTDIRRNIFIALMSSEDYMDAFEKLLKLGLSEVQEREIVRVTLHCAGGEKAYNPYYTLVLHRLCLLKHAFRVTLQYALWDYFRELGESDVGGMGEDTGKAQRPGRSNLKDDHSLPPLRRTVNLAKTYGWLLGKKSLSPMILRTLSFTHLQKHTELFLRTMLCHSILATQETSGMKRDTDAIIQVFSKARETPALAQGLLLFLNRYIRKAKFHGSPEEVEVVQWACKIITECLKSTKGL